MKESIWVAAARLLGLVNGGVGALILSSAIRHSSPVHVMWACFYIINGIVLAGVAQAAIKLSQAVESNAVP